MQDYYRHALTGERKTWTEWCRLKKFTATTILIQEGVLIHEDFTVDIIRRNRDFKENC